MSHFCIGRFPRGIPMIMLLCLANGFCENRSYGAASAGSAAACPSAATQDTGAYPAIELRCGNELKYVGTYSDDGSFIPSGKHARWYNQELEGSERVAGRPAEVPPFIDLHPNERVVESALPPKHATRPVKGHSRLASFRDSLITFAYGQEKVLLTPHHVVVDSLGRVIVTDPRAKAIHVLDGNHSFRLLTGRERRVAKPNGVAVDGDGNIYVADQGRGLVAVFDREGKFARNIGKLGDGENLFHQPTGIAIDRKHKRLYVLDSERHLIFELDLTGNILRRIGRFGGNDVVADLELPSEIAVGSDRLVVIDAGNSRVNVMDLQGGLEHRFYTGIRNEHTLGDQLGLAVDSLDHIYVSNLADSLVHVFDSYGHELNTFGMPGVQTGQFRSPTGLWVDEGNKVYVAEESNRRIQVFQMTSRGEPEADETVGPSGFEQADAIDRP